MTIKIHVYPCDDGREFCAYAPSGAAVSVVSYGKSRADAFVATAGRLPPDRTLEQIDYPTYASYRDSLTNDLI